MQYVRCPVSTTCLGMAASMGAVLLLTAGTKGRRLALPERSRIMIHQPSRRRARAGRRTSRSRRKEIRHMKDVITQILVDATGKSKDQIRQGHRPRLLHGRQRRRRSTGSSDDVLAPKKKYGKDRRRRRARNAERPRPFSALGAATVRGARICPERVRFGCGLPSLPTSGPAIARSRRHASGRKLAVALGGV